MKKLLHGLYAERKSLQVVFAPAFGFNFSKFTDGHLKLEGQRDPGFHQMVLLQTPFFPGTVSEILLWQFCRSLCFQDAEVLCLFSKRTEDSFNA